MNSKKANWAFLITIVFYFGAVLAVVVFFPSIVDNFVFSNFFAEVITLLPILIFMLATKEKLGSFLGFHRIKFRTILMIGLFTFLSTPVLTLANVISQIWVENEIGAVLADQQNQLPFLLMFLTAGVIAPVFEEVICRGAYYRSYCRSGSAFKAMIMSAIIFGLIHMNFNQAAYAFVMGIFAVLLVEATGSLWASILYHGFFNGGQVILLYALSAGNVDVYSEETVLTTDLLLCAIGIYLLLAAVTLPLAWAVLVWIGRTEGRSAVLSSIWSQRKEKKDKMVTVPFVLTLILCFLIMTGILYSLLSALILLRIFG